MGGIDGGKQFSELCRTPFRFCDDGIIGALSYGLWQRQSFVRMVTACSPKQPYLEPGLAVCAEQ